MSNIIILGVIGIILLSIAIGFYFEAKKMQVSGIRAEGVVVNESIEARISPSGNASSHKYIAFQTRDGKTIQIRSRLGQLPSSKTEGQEEKVGVIYQLDNPEGGLVDSFWELNGVWIIFGGVAVAFLIIAVVIAFVLL